MVSQQDVAEHFDQEAARYDYWKQKNWYYYDTLKAIARRWYRGGALLDVGCGTGAVVAAVAPERAVGVDISVEMIEIAKRKFSAHSAYSFVASDMADFASPERFDTILFFDVIEHLVDAGPTLRAIAAHLAPQGRVVVTMANPLWEPILMAGEKLGMKMPEGPHYRMPTTQFVRLAEKCGLVLVERDWRLVFPKYLPAVSTVLNSYIGRLPGMRRLSMIEIFIFAKAQPENKTTTS